MKFQIFAAVCAALVALSACSFETRVAPEKAPPAAQAERSSAPGATPVASKAAASKAPAASKPPAPAPEVIFAAPRVTLGETMVLHVKNAATATAKTDLPYQPVFYPDGDQLTAFLPVSGGTTVGSYKLSIQAGEKTFDYTISVEDREFVIQNLTMPQSTVDSTDTDAANLEWEQKIEPLKLTSEPTRYWEGAFTQPVSGEITTEFGTIRYTNGSKTASRHYGIDIAAATGTPIIAANAGKIQFAEFIQLTGNTVVIEHGFGLKSFYYHMDSLDVAAGDLVKKGDPVGKVGTTGYSTGPHLHYALLVNNIFINPWTAFDHGFE